MKEKNTPYNNQQQMGRTMWGIIADIAVVSFMLLLWKGLPIDAEILSKTAMKSFLLLGVYWFYKYKRQKSEIALTAEVFLQIMLFSVLASILNNFLSTVKRPLNDEFFKSVDLSIGFDWSKGAESFSNIGDSFRSLLEIGYLSLGPQLFAIILILATSSQFVRLHQVVIAIAFCVIAGMAFNIALPVANTFVNYDTLNGLVLSDICYSGFAVIFMYAVYEMRLLRLIFIPLNILLIASSPIFIGHYVTISIVGAIVALFCIALARKILPLQARLIEAQ